jgi:MFS family permease
VDKFQGPNPATGRLILTARNQNLVFSLPLVGAVLGGLLASPLNFHFGRKWPLVAAYLLSIGGGLLQVFAPNLGAFVGGRSINGVAMGIAMATAPLYLSEVRYTPYTDISVTRHSILEY